MQINCGAGQTTNNLNRKQIRSYSRFPFQACLLRLFFSKLLQELPLVALVQHKKNQPELHKAFHYNRG
jgi:hypothetical protein